METLNSYQKSRNITQSELARTLGVSRFSVISWEAGRTIPSRKTREKIEKITGPIQWKFRTNIEIKTVDPIDIGNKLQALVASIQMLPKKQKSIFRSIFLGIARTI